MNQKNVIIILVIILILVAGLGVYFISTKQITSLIPSPTPTNIECQADADCPENYICEAIQGITTGCPSSEPNCVSTFTITKGICKLSLKPGAGCNSDQECQGGLICSAKVCTNPIGRQCSSSDDTSCPKGYQCIQSCGPPVARDDDPPPPFYCELDEYAARPKMCPIERGRGII